jgi:ribonuclease T2
MRALILVAFALLSLVAAPNDPGVFDYYLLALSWSPEYCAGPSGGRDPVQCGEGRRFGFIVHGLWPQFERGYPADCQSTAPVPDSLVQAMLPLMPSPRLIQHEWRKHGTCSGMDVQGYFRFVQKAFASVRMPDDFRGPIRNIEVAPSTIRSKFASANPAFPANAFRIQCSGRYLSEVRVCLSKDLKPRPCSRDVRDTCRAETVVMRPLR